jgi:hypothetical protein
MSSWWEVFPLAALAGSAHCCECGGRRAVATLTYVTTETGVVIMIILGAVGAGLAKLRQSMPEPATAHR